MRIFLTTVAGSATRFSESIGKPTVKCIYNREDPAKTLLNHMLTQASDYDFFVVVGGFVTKGTVWASEPKQPKGGEYGRQADSHGGRGTGVGSCTGAG